GGDLAATFARNLLFDAFAHGSARRPAGRWTSVAWDLWQDGEALGAFRGLLARAATVPQILVSARPLERGWNRVARAPGAGDEAVVPEGARHPRPDLAVDYVAPRTEVEAVIAGVWQELLGIERIGVHDSFLDLGGDSLLASRLATRLRGALDLDLPVRLFFEASSIEQLAKAVEAIRGERLDEEMDALFEELSTLSDDEVMAELERRQQATAVELRGETSRWEIRGVETR
ncbi:MAG TPA: phosphopantetheine-binding protein, partial [Thermoanaerobaculia bacterium]|nr:phosphopantetheine-binding protein [Thermoanaerobaculia bacterium]